MNESDFLNPENWYGSHYELAIEYPKGNDTELLEAINSVWHQPELTGPWREKEGWGKDAQPVDDLETEDSNHCYGLIELEKSMVIGCLSLTVRESGNDGSDWLCLCIPTGMLELVFEVEYPIVRNRNPWLDIVDRFFLRCAIVVNNVSSFDLAIVGEEVSGYVNRKEVTPEIVKRGGYVLSKRLVDTLGMDLMSVALSDQLRWFPFKDPA